MRAKPKLLIVDDEQDACTSLRRVLRLDGYDVDIANSIEEMLRPRAWSELLAIILDRRLPDGTADELIPDLKARAPQAAVIIITAYADLESSVAALRHGAEDYILKPVNPDVLRATIARCAKLREAELRASQAERLAGIGQMMAAIAHESRNSLQHIQNGIDMLETEFADTPQALADVARIQRGANDIRLLLDGIREFAGPVILDRSDCDLATVWRRAWRNVTSLRAGPPAPLSELVSASSTSCCADSFRLEQVFRNLFENSLVACSVDPKIEIECADSTGCGQTGLTISVRDNGGGFEDGDASRVFEPFFSTKTKGTGLGMAIVKRTIEAHGGTIVVGEDQKPGVEFIITLPNSADSPADSPDLATDVATGTSD